MASLTRLLQPKFHHYFLWNVQPISLVTRSQRKLWPLNNVCALVNQNQVLSRHSHQKSSQPGRKDAVDDGIKYRITFKDQSAKTLFKKFYSIYGPLFVACHIGISLTSLGCFCSLAWLVPDPAQYMPEQMIIVLGEKMTNMTASGGKFVIAYALHKIVLPIRLAGAIFLTKKFGDKIKSKRSM